MPTDGDNAPVARFRRRLRTGNLQRKPHIHSLRCTFRWPHWWARRFRLSGIPNCARCRSSWEGAFASQSIKGRLSNPHEHEPHEHEPGWQIYGYARAEHTVLKDFGQAKVHQHDRDNVSITRYESLDMLRRHEILQAPEMIAQALAGYAQY